MTCKNDIFRQPIRGHGMITAAMIAVVVLPGCAGRTMQSASADATQSLTTGIFYALPRSYLTVTVSRDEKGVSFSAPGEIGPDPTYRYNLSFLPSAFAHDVLAIEVSKGLLNNEAKSDNTDQSVAIVKSLLDLAGQVANIARDETRTTAAKYTFTRAVDPFDPASIAALNYGLQRAGETELEFFVAETPSGHSASSGAAYPPPVDCAGSICFRLPTAIFPGLRLKRDESQVAAQQIVIVPDPRFTASIDVRRAPCIKQVTTLTFTSGMLTKNNLDKPSEILKCLEIPSAILSSLAGDLGKALGIGSKPASTVSQTVVVSPLSADASGSGRDPIPTSEGATPPRDGSSNPVTTKKVDGSDIPGGS